MNESYGGNIPARIWARFMKKALEKTKPHDFVMPIGEVHKLKLCGTGKDEVFVAGTEPVHTCGEADDTASPAPYYHHRRHAAVPVPAAAAIAHVAQGPRTPPTIVPLTPPPDVIGDGQTFVPLDAPPAPAGAATAPP
jgi:membrane peptidoglycan carboxypeptidase